VDLQLYLRVLWRHKLVVSAGILLALALAFLSFVRVGGSPFLQYRESEEFLSYAKLFVTKDGFELGKIAPSETSSGPAIADLTTFAIIYSQLADSDQVRALMLADGPIDGRIEVAPISATANSDEALPIISIAAFADSPRKAMSLASRQAAAVRDYVVAQQDEQLVPRSQRVNISVVKEPRTAEKVAGRGLTLPIVVFLTVMIAFIGLSFLLENLRPEETRVRASRIRSARPRSKTAA
jgi:hypothetical protein